MIWMSIVLFFILVVIACFEEVIPRKVAKHQSTRTKVRVVAGILAAFMAITGVFSVIESASNNAKIQRELTEYTTKTENIAIAALQDGNSTNGSFSGFLFVQSGKVDDVMYYRMMIQKGNKKRFFKLPAETTDIYEFEAGEDTPHLEVVWDIKKYDGKEVAVWSADSEFEGYSDTMGTIRKISIYVPKGTVDSEFKLDLE